MTTRVKYVRFSAKDRPPGWIDRSRFGIVHPDDKEERPVITEADAEATRQELRELRRRMTPKSA